MTGSGSSHGETNTRDEELLADLFDALLQDILDGRTPDVAGLHPDRPDLRERIDKTWQLACSVAGRREPSRPVLGGYEILRELGHGGMGTVYLARHQTLQRDVAIKVLPHSLAMSPLAKQRFVEEARALAQLRHENVVHVHRIIDHAEMLAFEMEFIDGMSLQALILALQQQSKPLALTSLAGVLGRDAASLGCRSTVEWFVRIAIRIARALGEVHRHGLVHRDVKPSNILMRADGTPVLADFGLALQGDLDGARTRFAGTPVYAAPERLRGGADLVDARTDVYSLGVTLYEALTASPPYQGSSTHEVLRRIESGRMPSLRQRAPHVSHDLALVVQKAMEPDRRHRYASADELADDLERLLALQPIHARPAGPLRRAWKFVRRHQRVFVAAVAGAVLVAGFVWPLAAHAAAREQARERAKVALHAARCRLLGPEVLPSSWSVQPGDGQTVQQASVVATRAAAFADALADYDQALGETPWDTDMQRERAVVAASLELARRSPDTGPAAVDASPLPPLCRAVLANAIAHRRLLDGTESLLPTSSEDDRASAGLFAFLSGDPQACGACWERLPTGRDDEALLDACTALRLAGEGSAERAYPRLFHAARAFPRASAIGLSLADAAIGVGDLALARQWMTSLPKDGGELLATQSDILAADLLAAEGRDEEAAQHYRRRSAADRGDPVPLLRLADLALRTGNDERAERMLVSLLQRWPDLAAARLRLARMALLRHDTAAYLAHARVALRQLHARSTIRAGDWLPILRLGGLRRLHDEEALANGGLRAGLRDADELPLSAWLTAEHVRGIEQVLRLLATIDDTAEGAARHDTRPIGIALRTAWMSLLRLPRLTSELPLSLQLAALVGLPALLGTPTDALGALLLPYQRSLGTRLHPIPDRRVFTKNLDAPPVAYGLQVLRLGDLDGDTLDDLCITAPPASRDLAAAYLEVRSAADGSLMHSWSHGDPHVMFARAAAALGDVDGDLCSDLVVGMPIGTTESDSPAAVELWSGRTGRRLWRIENKSPSFGAAVAATGDLDGDGVPDVLVGCSPLSRSQLGEAHVLSGRDGHSLHTLRAERTGVWFGGAVASAGDVTGDGVDDLLVGGNFGGAPGLVTVFDGRTGEQRTSFADANETTNFGRSVLAVGDLDEDRFGDIAIAAPGSPSASGDPGRVLVFSGRTGKVLFELRGERPRDQFGESLCYLPTWRRDQRPALAVAAAAGGPVGNGYVRVFTLDSGAPLQTFAGHPSHRRFGYSLVDLGDRDRDGLRDLGVMALRGDGRAEFFAMTFADAFATPPAAASTVRPNEPPRGVLRK